MSPGGGPGTARSRGPRRGFGVKSARWPPVIAGLEEEVRRAIAPDRLEFDENPPVGAEADAVLGEWGAEPLATELLQASDGWGDSDVGVEV